MHLQGEGVLFYREFYNLLYKSHVEYKPAPADWQAVATLHDLLFVHQCSNTFCGHLARLNIPNFA